MGIKSFSELPSLPDDIVSVGNLEKIKTSNKGVKRIDRALQRFFTPIKSNKKPTEIGFAPVDNMAARVFLKGEKIMRHNKILDPNSTLEFELGLELIKRRDKIMKNIKEFTQEVSDSKRDLADATDNWRADVLEFTDELPKAVAKIRQFRMTITKERNLSIDALSDLRNFFLDKDHDNEMRRLNDFVRTCEKLKALSDDGTLDRVSEVMLKLSE